MCIYYICNRRHVLYWITIQCCFQELMFLQLLNCSKLALLTHFNDVYLEKKTHIGYWTKMRGGKGEG